MPLRGFIVRSRAWPGVHAGADPEGARHRGRLRRRGHQGRVRRRPTPPLQFMVVVVSLQELAQQDICICRQLVCVGVWRTVQSLDSSTTHDSVTHDSASPGAVGTPGATGAPGAGSAAAAC